MFKDKRGRTEAGRFTRCPARPEAFRPDSESIRPEYEVVSPED